MNYFLTSSVDCVVVQRVYDDDEDEDEDAAADSSNGPTFVDPIVNLKEAFSLGQSALKLFFFEDNQDDKFEVLNPYT